MMTDTWRCHGLLTDACVWLSIKFHLWEKQRFSVFSGDCWRQSFLSADSKVWIHQSLQILQWTKCIHLKPACKQCLWLLASFRWYICLYKLTKPDIPMQTQSLTYPFRRCYLQTETLPGEMTWKYRKVLFFAGPYFRISWYLQKHPVQNQCYLIISEIKKLNFVREKTAKKQCVWQPAGGPGARTAGDWKDV